jgi:acyl-CoA synthetase (AMP-forming)/AMP-acid ligase II
MNLRSRLHISRDKTVTVANLVDKLLLHNGDYEGGVETDGTPWRLSTLHEKITAIDSFLRISISLRPGQPVAIYRTNDRSCFHWFLGIIRAGGIAVPLNPQLSLAEVRRILATSGTEILITDRAVFDRTIQARTVLDIPTCIQAEDDPSIPTLDGFIRAEFDPVSPTFPPVVVLSSATVAVFHTSGTSGFPKGAALSSRALMGARSSTVFAGLIFSPKDLALIALPWSHIMAVSIALYGLMAGLRGCVLEKFEVPSVLEIVERLKISTVVGVPAMFARLVNSNPDPARLASVRVWLSASDYLPPEVRQRLRAFGALLRLPGSRRIPPVLLNGYGMVELGGLAMMGIELSFLPGSGDLCFPVPPFKIRVAGEDGRPMRAGATGECQIRRRGISPHYWKDEASACNTQNSVQKNGEAPHLALLTPDGWLRTGDLATRNRFGLIRLVGRTKDVIKSGGYSVYVRELDEALAAHPAVARAAAFGLPHPEKGEMPVAAVELHPGFSATETDLLDFCRQNLAAYKSPRHIWIIAPGTLPQNHNGKFVRATLQKRFSTETLAS